jgi:hypothetical protein
LVDHGLINAAGTLLKSVQENRIDLLNWQVSVIGAWR